MSKVTGTLKNTSELRIKTAMSKAHNIAWGLAVIESRRDMQRAEVEVEAHHRLLSQSEDGIFIHCRVRDESFYIRIVDVVEHVWEAYQEFRMLSVGLLSLCPEVELDPNNPNRQTLEPDPSPSFWTKLKRFFF